MPPEHRLEPCAGFVSLSLALSWTELGSGPGSSLWTGFICAHWDSSTTLSC